MVLVARVQVGQVDGEFATNICVVDALFYVSNINSVLTLFDLKLNLQGMQRGSGRDGLKVDQSVTKSFYRASTTPRKAGSGQLPFPD